MRGWPKPKSVRDIQVFIRFTNFYKHFIQGFSKIATLLTLIMKISASDTDGAIGDKKQNRFSEKISKMTKSKSTKSSSESGFLTFEARIAFIPLR